MCEYQNCSHSVYYNKLFIHTHSGMVQSHSQCIVRCKTDHDPGLFLLVGEAQLVELCLVLELIQETLMNIHERASQVGICRRRQLLKRMQIAQDRAGIPQFYTVHFS